MHYVCFNFICSYHFLQVSTPTILQNSDLKGLQFLSYVTFATGSTQYPTELHTELIDYFRLFIVATGCPSEQHPQKTVSCYGG